MINCDICNERIPVICSYTFKVGDDNFGYDTICTVCKTCKEKIITKLNYMTAKYGRSNNEETENETNN